ncbi:MAG: glycosyltransferase family 2 protein [Ferruginibacter sp.]
MRTEFPLISIIIPTYNRAAIIGDTLNSVKHQSYDNWECIIVDDASGDDTSAVVKNYVDADPRYRYLANKRTKGAPGARNTGVENSTGSYLIFLDSDDQLSKDCLLNRLNKFQLYPEPDFLVFSTVEYKETITDTNLLINVSTKENIIERFLNLDIPWITCGAVWKRESFLRLGGWDEKILSWQDWELHINALLKNYQYLYFSTVDSYWKSNDATDSIGKHTFTSEHFRSHLRLTSNLKEKMKDNPRYLSLLNGLIYWLSERALEQGFYELSKEALINSHEDLHVAKKAINLFGLGVFKKLPIKHPRVPGFGTYRKVFFYT